MKSDFTGVKWVDYSVFRDFCRLLTEFMTQA